MNNDPAKNALEELDLAIPNSADADHEKRLAVLLRDLPGIDFARITERGAFVRYRPSSISAEQICAAAHQAGFRASIFQDSKSGRTGHSSS